MATFHSDRMFQMQLLLRQEALLHNTTNINGKFKNRQNPTMAMLPVYKMHKEMSMLGPDGMIAEDLIFEDVPNEDRPDNFLYSLIATAKNGNLSGLVLLVVVLTCIVLVFLACYVMMRFMHRSLATGDLKDPLSSQYSNVVMHSKRVYEIQAEEGCFPMPPDPNFSSSESDYQSASEEQKEEARNTLKKPETGDLRAIRDVPPVDDPRQMLRRKERKIHKDSVCAFLFRPNQEPGVAV